MAYIQRVGGGHSSPTFLRRGINLRINLRAVIPALVIGSLAAIPSFATSVSGTAYISGGVNVSTDLTTGVSTIMFPGAFLPTTGAASTGSFAGLTSGSFQTLSGTALTGAISVPDFGTFVTPTGNVYFDLTNVLAGIGSSSTSACGVNAPVGSVCTPSGSPFTLTQYNGSVGIQLQLDGTAYMSTRNGTSQAVAIFTTQDITVQGVTIGEILNDVANGGFASSYSATFDAVPVSNTPEPASLLLMGVGLLGAGIIARKKVRS
jgi:hypothetical protein